MLEKEIEGMMKKKIDFTVKDIHGGSRTLDYMSVLNQKENEIITLSKKIENLEAKLASSHAR